VATLFWFGNDLMWIEDMAYREASPMRILQGVLNATIYAKELGFSDDSFPIEQLHLAIKAIRQMREVSPSVEETQSNFQEGCREIRQYIQAIKWYVHRLAIEQEPHFKKKTAV
jgi:hypothetical protein